MTDIEQGSQPNFGSSEPVFKPDDDQLAIEIKEDWREKVAFFYSSWRVYEGGCWIGRTESEVRRHIRQWLRDQRNRGVNVSQNRIRSLTAMLEDDLYISDRLLMESQERQKNYVNLKNGMFNLDTMQLEDHRPELYFINQLDFDYDDDADCPTFRKFLNSSLVFPDGTTDRKLVMLTLEAMGYSMTARTDMKSSFWLVGAKDSGKSTFISLLKNLMGSLHGTIDLTQLGTNRFLLAPIVGKRVVTFTEASSNTVLPDALYKTVTGGSDEVQADVKNRDPITFRPEAKIWWAMNEMPRIQDRSGATTRRIIIIPFNRTIPESDRISNLEHLLIQERSGIFNEMVTYYTRLQRAGQFEFCQQSEDQRNQYIMENDTEATFIEECAEFHESYKVQSTQLYSKYTEWCLTNGFKPKNRNQIAKEWRRLGFENRTSNGVWWHGIRLTESLRI